MGILMPTQKCLPQSRLKEYLSGWTDPEENAEIESHLSECEACERTVELLEADSDTLLEAIRVERNAEGDSAGNRSSEVEPSEKLSLNDDLLAYSLARAKRIELSADSEIAGDLHAAKNVETRVPGIADWRPPFEQLGPYKLLQPLGAGGMGAVFLARHEQLGKQVAVKLLPARPFRNDHYAARFQREIRTAGQLNHPAIVNSTDAGEQAGLHYLVMEYIDGLDLSRVARLAGPLKIADACELIRKVAIGLSYAHAEGIVHRDVKPSNLMLSRSGDVKILDFGLAQASLWDEASAELTTVGQLMGTLDYMAPEQAERADAVDYRADLYSLGATLFRLLCGRPPLAAAPDMSPIAKLRLLATHKAPALDTLREDAPEALVRLVAEMLDQDPNQRPASAAHVAERLGEFNAEADLTALIETAVDADELNADGAESRIGGEPKHPRELKHAEVDQPELRAAAVSGNGSNRMRWLALAAFLPLFLLAGVLVVLEMQKGRLVIESDQANVTVKLLKDGQPYRELSVMPGKMTTRLYAGKYELEIDAASDGVTVDQDAIRITRGDEVIARVQQVAPDEFANLEAGMAGSSVELPASDSPIQPGDILIVLEVANVEFSDEKLNSRVQVTADGKVKLPWVGWVDVDGKTLDEAAKMFAGKYSKFIKGPMVQVFAAPYSTQLQRTIAIDVAPSTGSRSSAVPPASDAKLKPGDRVLVRSLTYGDIDARVTVLADGKIRLPTIGLVNAGGKNLLELEQAMLEKLKYRNTNPHAEAFRDYSEVTSASLAATPETALRSGSSMLSSQANATADPSDQGLMYGGKPFDAWIEQLRRERSEAGMLEALEAVATLANEKNSVQIRDTILEILPQIVEIQSLRDSVLEAALAVLFASSESEPALFQSLADELETGAESYRFAVLSELFSLQSQNPPKASLTSWMPLIRFIDEHILVGNENIASASGKVQEATQIAAGKLLVALLAPNSKPDETQEAKEIAKVLRNAECLDLDFWFPLQTWTTNSHLASLIYGKALYGLLQEDLDSELAVFCALAIRNYEVRFPGSIVLPENFDFAKLFNSLDAWVLEVLSHPERLNQAVGLRNASGSLRESSRSFMLEVTSNARIEISVPAVISFTEVNNNGGVSLRVLASLYSKIGRLAQAEEVREQRLLARANATLEAMKPMMLSWWKGFPGIEASIIIVPGPSSKAIETKFPHELARLLASLVAELDDESVEEFNQNTTKWFCDALVNGELQRLDVDGDGKVDAKTEGGKYLGPLQDKNGDGLLDAEELFDYFFGAEKRDSRMLAAKPGRMLYRDFELAWARGQIERHDYNKNGKLDASEIETMIVKPNMDVDEDGDGAITDEEYAKSQRRMKANEDK